jgi:hypothetical protein
MSTFFEENQRYQIGLFVGRLNWDNWNSYENGTDPNCIETRLLKLTNKYFSKNLSLAEICEREGVDVNEFITQGLSLRARDLKNESSPV